MHNPAVFRERDTERLHEFIRAFPLATLIDVDESGAVDVTPAPCFLSADGGALELHLARSNPLARRLAFGERAVTLVFGGPSAYVSPTYYEHPDKHVPTWNYVTVVARGAAALTDPSELRALLERTTQRLEASVGSDWSLAKLDPSQLGAMLREIVGVRVAIGSLEGKFKLSQNRSAIDRERVRSRLEASDSVADRTAAKWMRA